jgi:hypothetical protein
MAVQTHRLDVYLDLRDGVQSYGRNWVMGVEKAAYRGG